MFVSDIPVHREQNLDDAAYFDPNSPKELADLIEAAWTHLVPGPDLGREHDARDAQQSLIRDFALSVRRPRPGAPRCFREIMTLIKATNGTVNLHIWREGKEYLRQKGHRFLSQWNNVVFAALPGAVSPYPLRRFEHDFAGVCRRGVRCGVHVPCLRASDTGRWSACAQQIFSALKPGGIFRVSVPDLETACRITWTCFAAAARGRGRIRALPLVSNGDLRTDGARSIRRHDARRDRAGRVRRRAAVRYVRRYASADGGKGSAGARDEPDSKRAPPHRPSADSANVFRPRALSASHRGSGAIDWIRA